MQYCGKGAGLAEIVLASPSDLFGARAEVSRCVIDSQRYAGIRHYVIKGRSSPLRVATIGWANKSHTCGIGDLG